MRTFLRCAAVGALTIAAQAADFSYYMLAISYAPEFCAHAGTNKDARECGVNRPAFVVHGLWPQQESGRGPQRCGPARPVAADLVRTMLNYFPNESLIQHEWATHGVCSGLSPADYFAAVRQTKDSIRIPQKFTDIRARILMSPNELESEFQAANPGVPRDAMRTACYADAGLQEVRFCFDKNLVARSCTGVPECVRPMLRLTPPLRR